MSSLHNQRLSSRTWTRTLKGDLVQLMEIPRCVYPTYATVRILTRDSIEDVRKHLWKFESRLTSFTLSLRCLAMESLSSPPTVNGSLSAGAGGTVSKTSALCTTNDEELLVRTRVSSMSGFSSVFCCWYSSSIFAWKRARFRDALRGSFRMARDATAIRRV